MPMTFTEVLLSGAAGLLSVAAVLATEPSDFVLGLLAGLASTSVLYGLWLLHDRSKDSWRHKGTELVGVLGGLGPAASALFAQIMVETGERAGALKDADHPPMIMYCNPELPNSRAAAVGEGPLPTKGMAYSFRQLLKAGATRVCVVCNTAHAFAEEAAKTAGAPFLDMIALAAENVVQRLKSEHPDRKAFKVGLMATDGTTKMGLYQKAVAAAASKILGAADAVEVVVPVDLSIVQGCILRIKGNDYRNNDVSSKLEKEALALVDKGAEVIITGCTELPVAFNEKTHPNCPVALINPMQELADEIVRLTKASQASE